MSATRSRLEQQAQGYEDYLRENWDRLPAWEQEQAQSYFAWREGNPRALVEPPPVIASPLAKAGSSWTVKAGYLAAVGAFLLYPIVFAPVGILLGIFNIVRGRYGHGIAHVFLSVAGAVLAIIVSSILLDWIVILQEQLVELQSSQRR